MENHIISCAHFGLCVKRNKYVQFLSKLLHLFHVLSDSIIVSVISIMLSFISSIKSVLQKSRSDADSNYYERTQIIYGTNLSTKFH